jgi:predicted nucleic acid-binding protein
MATGLALPDTLLALDSDILTEWRNRNPSVQQEITVYLSRHKRPLALTAMTVFEAFHGFEKVSAKSGGLDERTKQDRFKAEQLIQQCEILPFDKNAATIAAYIFPRLSQSERNKHWRDLFIAATALAHGHGVATRNKKDFELIATHLPPSHPLLRLAIWKP